MPTIEVASINSTGLNLEQSDFSFAIIEENRLESYRGLFSETLKHEKGTIVHIGNPDMKTNKGPGFFAGQIIDWAFESADTLITPEDTHSHQQIRFKISSEFKSDLDKLLRIAQRKSPVNRVFFLSDYQFGPEKENIEEVHSIDDFWTIHDNSGLSFNTLYHIRGRGSA